MTVEVLAMSTPVHFITLRVVLDLPGIKQAGTQTPLR